MTPDPEVDEDYASSEDSDFAPEDAARRDSSPDESGDEAGEDDATGAAPTSVKRKRKLGDDEAEDAGLENSGDEALIEKAKKRQKKAKDKGRNDLDDEDGGSGSMIKTRSQRAVEKAERKTYAATGPVTIDVDSLWAQMIAAPSATSQNRTATSKPDGDAAATAAGSAGAAASDTGQQKNGAGEPPAMIKIKRRYNFAGKVHTEEKLVVRDSAEAKLYLESLGKDVDPEAGIGDSAEDERPKAKPRKAFRSAFEPVFDQLSQRADLNLGMAARIRAREQAQEANAKKLTTVEKSRMDWAGYVDKEGIRDELVLAGKSKDSYAEREGFLARSEAIREDDARRARMAARA